MFTVSDLRTVWMTASINEGDISKVHFGQPVRLLVHAYPDQIFQGTVQRVGPQLDVTTRTLQARVLTSNQDLKLRPGMYANAQIELGASQPALFVPEEAVQDLNGGSIVFVRVAANTFDYALLFPGDQGATSAYLKGCTDFGVRRPE